MENNAIAYSFTPAKNPQRTTYEIKIIDRNTVATDSMGYALYRMDEKVEAFIRRRVVETNEAYRFDIMPNGNVTFGTTHKLKIDDVTDMVIFEEKSKQTKNPVPGKKPAKGPAKEHRKGGSRNQRNKSKSRYFRYTRNRNSTRRNGHRQVIHHDS